MDIETAGLRKVALAVLILCMASLACLGPELATPGDYVDRFGGDITTYTKILEMTDCTELQRELERADESSKRYESHTVQYREFMGYRTAAENRIKEVECAGNL